MRSCDNDIKSQTVEMFELNFFPSEIFAVVAKWLMSSKGEQSKLVHKLVKRGWMQMVTCIKVISTYLRRNCCKVYNIVSGNFHSDSYKIWGYILFAITLSI